MEQKIIDSLLEENELLKQQLEHAQQIIEDMEHREQSLVEAINNICRETVL